MIHDNDKLVSLCINTGSNTTGECGFCSGMKQYAEYMVVRQTEALATENCEQEERIKALETALAESHEQADYLGRCINVVEIDDELASRWALLMNDVAEPHPLLLDREQKG